MVILRCPIWTLPIWEGQAAWLEAVAPLGDMSAMRLARIVFPALLVLSLSGGAHGQSEPLRIVNGAAVPAIALHVARSGAADWGRNLLNQGPIRAGAFFALRMPEGAGCRFDIRLLLQDGQEIIRRDADICTERQQVLAPAMPAAPPQATLPLPQVGGGDQFLPAIQGARP
jgi:hypothetical protein